MTLRRPFVAAVFLPFLITCSMFATTPTVQNGAHAAESLSTETMRQIGALLHEKALRTPAQQRMDSQLLQASRESRGQRMEATVALRPAQIGVMANGRLLVDIDVHAPADVASLVNKVRALGGKIIYPSVEFKTVRAEVPLAKTEEIAAYPETRFIQPARQGAPGSTSADALDPLPPYKPFAASFGESAASRIAARHAAMKTQLATAFGDRKAKTDAGMIDSEGDVTHRAVDVRNQYGVDGSGLRIGVLSDSYDAFGLAATDVANGELPGTSNPYGRTTPVTVLNDVPYGADEGRAMLQIVHDLAPGAQLFFASADISEASFASNILALRNTYHCDIIIDDFSYFDEPVFQDGIVAQAVATVTADGALFFTNAGNEGAIELGTGAVWEGDFNDAGSPAFAYPGGAKTGTIHNFGTVGSPLNGDIITRRAQWAYELKWADPLGASSNDYDLFYVNSSGVVVAQSTNIQDGTQDPLEQISPPSLNAGDRLVVFKASSAVALPFSIDALRGRLSLATTGQIFGHHDVPGAFCVAATPAHFPAGPGFPTGPYPSSFTGSNLVELFESDGPRRMFFNADGSAITPGNISFGGNGGAVRNVPDFTAADGVATTFDQNSGFNPFYGTSAAAPHAGAIAALLKSANPSLTAAQLRTILKSTAVDIQSAGYDNLSGSGILQAFQAMQAVAPTPFANVTLGTVTATEGAFSNSNGVIDPGELASMTVQLKNVSTLAATSVNATLSTTTPGVTITQGTASYGTIAAGGNTTNSGTPFQFGVASSVSCGTVIDFYLTVSFGGGPSPQTLFFTVKTGTEQGATISTTLGSPPASTPPFTSTTGTQTGVVSWNFVTASCASPKSSPGAFPTGSRQFDAYTFTNTTGGSRCVTVTMTVGNNTALDTTTYNNSGYVPATPSVNYLADGGSGGYLVTYSFNVASGQSFTTVVSDDVAGPSSNAPYTLDVDFAGCSAAAPSCPSLSTGSAVLPNGAVGSAYSQALPVSGGSGAYSFVLASGAPPLPGGLTLSPSGVLSGTPTQAGVNLPVQVQVTDAAGCPGGGVVSYTMTIGGTPAAAITAFSGTPQSTSPSTTFGLPLVAKVVNAFSNPLSGVAVQFVAPSSGASGTFTGGSTSATVTTNAAGLATSPAFTANAISGSYSVSTVAYGLGALAPASFSLNNNCSSAAIVTSNADSGANTLRDILANPCAGQTITFDPSVTNILLTSDELQITKAVTISGPGADKLTISGGNSGHRVFEIAAGTAAVSISGMTIRDGKPLAEGGAGILVNNGPGGGTLTLTDSVVTNNDATLAGPTHSYGGGIYVKTGSLVVSRSAIVNNTAVNVGGGVINGIGGAQISDSTIAFNTAASGIGGGIWSSGNLTLQNDTIYGNSAATGGNLDVFSGAVTIDSSIVAGGVIVGAGSAPDINGIVTANYSLIQDTTGATITGSNNVTGQSPLLSALGNWGGTTPSLLPLPASPVINVANPTQALTLDQRSFPRVVGSIADIGAIETNYTLAATSGAGQSTLISTSFASPLKATVKESGNGIQGINVQFTTPSFGANATLNASTTATAATDVNGVATSPTPVANGTGGSYNVTAAVANATSIPTVNFGLMNIPTTPLTISNAFGTTPIVFGQTTSLTFSIHNTNSITATGVAFTDSLPAGLAVATPSALSNGCGGTATATAGSSAVSLSGGSIGASTTCTVSLNVIAVGLGTQNNTTSTIASSNIGTGSASNTASVVVNKASTLVVVSIPNPPLVAHTPQTIVATISVVAPGSGTPTGSITFKDNGTPIGSATISAIGPIASVSTAGGAATPASGSSAAPTMRRHAVTTTGAITLHAVNGKPVATGTRFVIVDASGQATLTIDTLAGGSHSITAEYGGDADFNGTTSAADVVTVLADIPAVDARTLILLALALATLALAQLARGR